MPPLRKSPRDAEWREMFRTIRRIAVVGASDRRTAAGFYVPEYLAAQGYSVSAVNPRLAGAQLFGTPVVTELADLESPVDLVVVFRRIEHLPGHLPELLAMTPRPRWVWLQLGIRDDAFADALKAAGIEVVQDRCSLVEHRRLGVGPVS